MIRNTIPHNVSNFRSGQVYLVRVYVSSIKAYSLVMACLFGQSMTDPSNYLRVWQSMSIRSEDGCLCGHCTFGQSMSIGQGKSTSARACPLYILSLEKMVS